MMDLALYREKDNNTDDLERSGAALTRGNSSRRRPAPELI